MEHLQFSSRRVLVTGASGFIGKHLVERLLESSTEVHAVSRQVQCEDLDGVTWWKADLADVDEAYHLLSSIRPDFIFHLASHVAGGRDIALVRPTFRSNLLSTVNLLTAAAEVGCKRLIITGSLEEPDISSGAVPCSPYAAAKSAGSAYARMFHALYGVPVVILRLFMVYGPGQRDGRKLVPYVIQSLLRGESPLLSSGTREVDWIYIDDVVNGLLKAAHADGIEGSTIDIGSGELVSVREVVERLTDQINPGVIPQFGALAERPLEQLRVANVLNSFSKLQWRPSVTLQEGLMRMVAWYQDQHKSIRNAVEVPHPIPVVAMAP
jgi:nucleoside-diphosphate-sugar epimerase